MNKTVLTLNLIYVICSGSVYAENQAQKAIPSESESTSEPVNNVTRYMQLQNDSPIDGEQPEARGLFIETTNPDNNSRETFFAAEVKRNQPGTIDKSMVVINETVLDHQIPVSDESDADVDDFLNSLTDEEILALFNEFAAQPLVNDGE